MHDASESLSKTLPLNIAALAVTRFAADRGRLALVWEGIDGTVVKQTFFEINREANRFANLLAGLGIMPGDRVFTLMNRTPELYAAIPGILKTGASAGVFFPDFGVEAIRQRLADSGAKTVVTDVANVEKIAEIFERLPELTSVVVSGNWRTDGDFYSLRELLMNSSAEFADAEVERDSNCLLIYTSGTTGLPKGVVHRHAIAERLAITARSVLKLSENDLYWCTADPGWVTGLNYGILAPWLNGLPVFVFEGEFDARRWLDIFDRHQITCLYTTPTALRLMRSEIGDEEVGAKLRIDRIFSAGEPLNPEVIDWTEKTFSAPVFDNYWQTETGSQIIANRPDVPVVAGSMGKAVDGVNVAIIDDEGRELPPNEVGDIAIRPDLSSLFKGYWNFPDSTRACFRRGWYVTRDRGKLDENGYFWYLARTDDVITCEAQRVGPFEVESAILAHPAVYESAAVGVTDAVRTEHVKAFVVVRKGFVASQKLADAIAAVVRSQLSPQATPREIEFVGELPKTKSGKIQRETLRRGGVFDTDLSFKVSTSDGTG